MNLAGRIDAYVDACPPAVSGQHGHDQTFTVAISLIRGFDLSPERALSFLQRYNQRCQPKWTTAELKHKLRDADRVESTGRPLKTRGYLLQAVSAPSSLLFKTRRYEPRRNSARLSATGKARGLGKRFQWHDGLARRPRLLGRGHSANHVER
jgi:hypothetical protein